VWSGRSLGAQEQIFQAEKNILLKDGSNSPGATVFRRANPLILSAGITRMILGVMVLICCFAAYAKPVLSLDEARQSYSLGELVEYLEDESGQLEINELRQRPEQAWRKHSGEIPNFGFSQSAYWFRIELQTKEPQRWVLGIDYPLLDEVTLHTFVGARPLQSVQTGDSRPYIDRPLKHVAFDMPLVLPSAGPVTVYLRVKSSGTVQVPINLWQEDAYLEHYETITTIQGIYFGIVLIMTFYNLLLYVMVRERAYIHYVLFVAMIGLFTAGLYGWGYKYLWPEAVRFQQYNVAVFISLSTIFGARFINHFLDLPHTAPRIGYLLLGVVVSQIAAFLLLPVLGFHLGIQIVLALTFITAVTTLYAGIRLWRQGKHTARYFTSAWGLFLFSVLLATLERFGFLPSMFWTGFFLPLGIVSIVSLLSLALADRLNTEKQQRIQAQQQVIQLQKENQEELERKVNERTIELERTNQLLEKELLDHRRAELALHDSEERFRKAFQNSAIGMALIGLDGHWLKVNDALCHIVGYSEQELLDKTFQDIAHPDDLQSEMDFVARLLTGEIDHYQMETRYLHKAGHVVWIRLSVSLIRDAQNDPIHFVAQIDDITKDKHAEEEIYRLNESLEVKIQERTRQLLVAQDELVRKEKLAVLGQVAGSVGHELRNPLGVMSNAVYFLQTVLVDADETTREYLGIIESEIAESERIVADLLDAVRTKPPQIETVSASELISQSLRKCDVPSAVAIYLDVPKTLPPLQVDPKQIQQVLWNLITNGVEAMPDGGDLEIWAVEDKPAQALRISIKDSGTGIALENHAKLFQPLFTTKARRVGLGLVVVKNLTQVNRGSVDMQSQPGEGTTFSITLPTGGSHA